MNPDFLSHFLKNHIPWILWGLMIIVLVSIPGDDLPELSESVNLLQPDKLVHVFLFLVFVFLLQRGFDPPYTSRYARENLYFYTVLTGIILSGGTEIFQYFCISGRNSTLKDFLFNSLGCIIGWLVYSVLREKIHHRFHRLNRFKTDESV
jgi:glycopeptide antibiotics resistance protein